MEREIYNLIDIMDKTQYKDVYVFVEQRDGQVQKVAIGIWILCGD